MRAAVSNKTQGPFGRLGAVESEAGMESHIDLMQSLLWDEHLECCGSPQVGAEYMGQQELVCCGCPEPALLNAEQIVATLRAHYPDRNIKAPDTPDGWCPVCGGQDDQHMPGCEPEPGGFAI